MKVRAWLIQYFRGEREVPKAGKLVPSVEATLNHSIAGIYDSSSQVWCKGQCVSQGFTVGAELLQKCHAPENRRRCGWSEAIFIQIPRN